MAAGKPRLFRAVRTLDEVGPFAPGVSRRQWLTRALVVGALTLGRSLIGRDAFAEETRVPPRLQAELLAKVAAYDGRFAARSQGRALVLIVVAPSVADSERFGAQIGAELAKQPRIGGLEHMEQSIRYSSPAELARVCRERKPAILYLGPGLTEQAPAIAEALAGLDLLSVAALPSDVARGIVLGFEVVSGKPKLLVELQQARRQNVAFKPELLRLARVFQ